MKTKTDLLLPFENHPYFTIDGFKQIKGIEKTKQVRNMLYLWVKAGHVLRLKRGVYMTRSFYEKHNREYSFLKMVSTILLPQSYLSLDYVLQQHNILTESTYPITCITTKNTRKISNDFGEFWYKHIRKDLYLGFKMDEYLGVLFAQASLAKALFDFLYLRPIPEKYRGRKTNLAEELRLNIDELSLEDREEFSLYIEKSNSPKMKEIKKNFRRYSWRS